MGQVATKTFPLYTFILVINGPLKREVSHSILSFLSLMNHLKGQFFSFLSKMVNFNKSLEKIHAIFGHFLKKKCKFARRFSETV